MKGVDSRDAVILILVVGFAGWVIYGLSQNSTVTTAQNVDGS